MTTTAIWIRALLKNQFAVRLDTVEWVTFEESHVAGVPEPPGVRRIAPGTDLVTMLHDGSIDAAIVDPIPADARFGSVVPDPEAAFVAWCRQHGGRTLSHLLVVRESIAADAPLMRELFRLFRESRDLAGATVDHVSIPLGLTANRKNLEVAIAVADAEGLLARPLTTSSPKSLLYFNQSGELRLRGPPMPSPARPQRQTPLRPRSLTH